MQHHYIQEQTALEELCQKLSQSSLLAVDTEFVRTRTLLPKLGLLQVCDGEHLALIDPIAIDDLSSFWQLISDASIVKVLHACSEDLEVFLTAGNCRPQNLIDSQIMMAFLGHGLSLGYAAMVQHFLGIEIDKSESRTDWTKRPLSEKQLTYASADVEHLFEIYPKLLAQVTEAGWLEASQQESDLMIARKFMPIDEGSLYLNIKQAWRLNPKQLNNLKFLARWRYQRAKEKDLPLGFIAKDHTLLAVAQYQPSHVGAMSQLDGVETLDVRHRGKSMIRVLKDAEMADEASYPAKVSRLDEYPGYKQIFKKVKQYVTSVAEQSGITVEHLASKKQINQFLSFYFGLNGMAEKRDSVDLLINWRLPLLGEPLIAFADNNFQ